MGPMGTCRGCGRPVAESDLCSRPDCDTGLDYDEDTEDGEPTPDGPPQDPREDDEMDALGADSWWAT